jgi:hypothetical protein
MRVVEKLRLLFALSGCGEFFPELERPLSFPCGRCGVGFSRGVMVRSPRFAGGRDRGVKDPMAWAGRLPGEAAEVASKVLHLDFPFRTASEGHRHLL